MTRPLLDRPARRALALVVGLVLLGPGLVLLVVLPLLARVVGDGSDPWWPVTRWTRFAGLLPRAAAAIDRWGEGVRTPTRCSGANDAAAG
jgi:hypothetical protein